LLFTGRSVGQGSIGEDAAGANSAFGADGTFTFFDFLTINSYWAQTRADRAPRGYDTSYRTFVEYLGDRYGMQLERLSVDERFNPGIGFVRRTDIRRSAGQLRFSPRPKRFKTVRKFSWTGSGAYIENAAGRVESREQAVEFGIEYQSADTLTFSYAGLYEFVPRPFRIASSVTVPVGGYDTDTVAVNYTFGPQRKVVIGLNAEYGTFYSGHRMAISATRGRMNLGPRFSLEPTYSVNRVNLVEGAFTTHLAGSRVTYTMTPQMFASSLVQFNSSSNAVTANVRLRWEYQPGSELFVVFNEQRDTFGSRFPTLTNRAVIVKINRLFRL